MGELDTIQDYLKQLKAEEKHDQYIKLLNTLLPYVAPKMKESDEKGNSSTAPTINLILDSNGAEVIRKANDGLVAVNNQPD
jgi:DNA topoisomerase VI subunit B